MQEQNVVQLNIEYLLFDLSQCIHDLQDLRLQLAMDDIQRAELSLQKLSALISHVKNRSNTIKFAVI